MKNIFGTLDSEDESSIKNNVHILETNENVMASRLNELKQITTDIGSVMYEAFNNTNNQLEEIASCPSSV